MENKISIIVPVYNVEKYIGKCLDSLVKQDYSNYDILVVNDGSPFNEQAIIDEYVKKYPSIIKSIVKENGGYGSVLQLAFNKSDADYILVCDPDDYLADDALSTLISYQKKDDVDLVVGAKNLVYEDSDEETYDASYNAEFGKLVDGKKYTRGNKDFDMLFFLEPSPHAKLYKRSIVKDIIFPTKVSYTDNLLYFYTLNNVKSVTYCEKALSYYLINRSGNTRTDLKPTIIDSWVKVFNSIMDQVSNPCDIFYYRMFESFYSIYYKIDNIGGDKDVKFSKYELLYSFLEKLIKHKDLILKYNDLYQEESHKMRKQKEALLSSDTSLKTYNKLVNDRVNGSLKTKLKNRILDTKLYSIYHFHAKYYKTRNDEKMYLDKDVKGDLVFNDDKVHFFGYYVRPCVYNGKILSHRLNEDNFNYKQEIDILVDDEKISSSKAWNFQQGSMATWTSDKHIIHNDFDGSKYISKLINLETKEVKIIDYPIYSVSNDGSFSLSLNFSRLAKLRKDYGYFNLPYNELEDESNDGIYYVDIKNNTYSLWLSLKDIKGFKTSDTMINATHKVNHIDLSPDNTKAIFLHRWFKNDVKYTRLLCVDLKTKELRVLADNKMVSHMCWYDNETLFGYLRGNNNQDGYFFVDLDGNQKHFKHELLVDDGHPTVLNKRYIVTDSYPDYTCKSKLMLIDLKKNTVKILGKFYSYKKYQDDRRCDLHPRFDDLGNMLTLDTVCSGKRNICHLDISALIEKQ